MSAEGVMSGGQAEVTKGENARMSSFVGAIAIADLVKTTLGPKGKKRTIVINVWNEWLDSLIFTILCTHSRYIVFVRYG